MSGLALAITIDDGSREHAVSESPNLLGRSIVDLELSSTTARVNAHGCPGKWPLVDTLTHVSAKEQVVRALVGKGANQPHFGRAKVLSLVSDHVVEWSRDALLKSLSGIVAQLAPGHQSPLPQKLARLFTDLPYAQSLAHPERSTTSGARYLSVASPIREPARFDKRVPLGATQTLSGTFPGRRAGWRCPESRPFLGSRQP